MIIITTKNRYQPGYENEAVKSFMRSLPGHEHLRKSGGKIKRPVINHLVITIKGNNCVCFS
jgi:hypothetical protein